MPLYDYTCTTCDHSFEVFQAMNAPALRKCQKCKCKTLERIIGAPAIRTDATFSRGKGTLLQQYGGDEAEVKRVTDCAKKQGYTPRDTDIYEPCIASCKGDPKAFLPASDPVGALKRVCAARGIGADGRGVNIKSTPEREPQRKRHLATA